MLSSIKEIKLFYKTIISHISPEKKLLRSSSHHLGMVLADFREKQSSKYWINTRNFQFNIILPLSKILNSTKTSSHYWVLFYLESPQYFDQVFPYLHDSIILKGPEERDCHSNIWFVKVIRISGRICNQQQGLQCYQWVHILFFTTLSFSKMNYNIVTFLTYLRNCFSF